VKKTCVTLGILVSFFLCFATAFASNEIQHSQHKNLRADISTDAPANHHNSALLAQAGSAQGERPARDPEKFHEMIAWRFIKYLDLNEDQSAKFIPIFKESNKLRGALQKESRDLIDKVAKEVDTESVSTDELKKQLAKLKKLNKDISDERERFLNKMEGILTERQSVKLEIFEDKFKNDLYKRFRESNRRRREEERSNQNN
jgi:Spy/CpxP family protein refolding chaperone